MVSLATEISVHPCIFYSVVNTVLPHFFHFTVSSLMLCLPVLQSVPKSVQFVNWNNSRNVYSTGKTNIFLEC